MKKLRICILGFDTSADAAIRHKDALAADIVGIVEPHHCEVARAAVRSASRLDVIVTPDINQAPVCDAVIVSRSPTLREVVRSEMIERARRWSIDHRTPLITSGSQSGSLLEALQTQGADSSLLTRYTAPSINIPIIAIVSVRDNAEVFRTHIELVSGFRVNGIAAANLSSDPLVLLLHDGIFDTTISDKDARSTTREQFILTELTIRRTVCARGAEIAVCSPHSSLYTDRAIPDFINDADGRFGYAALRTYAWLMAVKPDAVLLVSNPSDEEKHIKQAITAIAGITDARFIGIAATEVFVHPSFSLHTYDTSRVTPRERSARTRWLAETFGLPAFDLCSSSGIKQMVNASIGAFCKQSAQ